MGTLPQAPTLLLPLTDIDLPKYVSIVNLNTLKNNTEETNSKWYASFRALLRLFLTSNFKNDDKYFAPPEIFFVPPGCVGLATALRWRLGLVIVGFRVRWSLAADFLLVHNKNVLVTRVCQQQSMRRGRCWMKAWKTSGFCGKTT